MEYIVFVIVLSILVVRTYTDYENENKNKIGAIIPEKYVYVILIMRVLNIYEHGEEMYENASNI